MATASLRRDSNFVPGAELPASFPSLRCCTGRRDLSLFLSGAPFLAGVVVDFDRFLFRDEVPVCLPSVNDQLPSTTLDNATLEPNFEMAVA